MFKTGNTLLLGFGKDVQLNFHTPQTEISIPHWSL